MPQQPAWHSLLAGNKIYNNNQPTTKQQQNKTTQNKTKSSFFIKTVSPKTEIKSAKYLTMAQIGQFITGIVITIPYFVLVSTSCRTTSSSFFMLAFFHFYGISLIVLFTAFAQKKYKKT